MTIRLSKATKECNVGLQTAVEFLQKKGFKDIEPNPNSKITEEQYQLLLNEFTADKGLRNEVIQLQQQRQEEKEKEKAEQQRKKAEQQVIKASSEKLAGPKILGTIDLDAPAKQAEAPKQEEKPVETVAPKQETKPAKAETPEQEKPKAVEPKAETPQKEAPKQEAPKAEAPNPEKPNIPEESAEASAETIAAPGGVAHTVGSDGVFRPTVGNTSAGPKVLGTIDLSTLNQSTRPKRKSKDERRKERESRQRAGQKVDVNAIIQQGGGQNRPKTQGNGKNQGGKGPQNQQAQNQQAQGKKKKKNQPKQAVQPAEVNEEDVAKQVRETLARLTSKGSKLGKGAKYRRDKREAIRESMEEEMNAQAAESKTLKLTEFVTANELATMMNVPITKIIGTCMSVGIMVSINQRLDAETINLVAEEYGFKTEYVSAEVSEAVVEAEDDEADLVPRAPIVTVMGHVDHGKTSLLDYIRQTNVIAGEAGGITQHIGAYNVTLEDGRHVTFLDTPGHEAFTAMRARGAQVTDVAIIIIAADDNIMPQTKEAINHAMAANVPIVFAINKIDKPAANPEKIKEELAQMNFLVEDWGGKYQSQDISAKKGIGVPELLDKVLLEAEMLDLKANPNRKGTGTVIESSLDKGRGYVATVMCSNGTLRMGDIVLAGTSYGRVKAMFNERGQRVQEIGPSQAATILGLNGAPTAGDTFHVMDTDQEAREIATKREQLAREQGLRTMKRVDLNELGRRIALGDFKELNIIVKGDVDGSIEALSDSLLKLSTEKIQVNVIQKAVGQISESDVNLAAASDAIIVAFQVRPSAAARKLAEQEGVDIRTYSVIYDAIEEIKDAMEGMLSPEIKEEITAQVEVRQVYRISKVGTVAGAYVIDGKVARSNKVRVVRDGIVIATDEINALKRFKDDVKEVTTNFECGISLVKFQDLKEGDILETFQEIEVKAKL
ncbi:MAG: translation initiation factor IF-2 [Bacteroidaceae bacterium]|nr:translation initiation factor IF-2 [Prevotellaceae bacterium]MDY5631582.1 translation initiation factor IF-2 [Bacteroidaceae bacterium]